MLNLGNSAWNYASVLALTLLSRPLPPALFWDYIQITPKSVNAACPKRWKDIGEIECLVKRDQQGGAFQEQKLHLPQSIWWICGFVSGFCFQEMSVQFQILNCQRFGWKIKKITTGQNSVFYQNTTISCRSPHERQVFSFWTELWMKFLTLATDFCPQISSSQWDPWFSRRFDKLLWILKKSLTA